MLTLEPAHPLLQPVEPGLRLAELDFQEVCGAARLPFARPDVLLGVERRERVRDARYSRWVVPLVSDREGHRGLAQAFELCALDLELDISAHACDGGLEGGVLPQLSVEVESFDQFR